MITNYSERVTLVPICPKCQIPRSIIVAPKEYPEQAVRVYCQECQTMIPLSELEFKRV